MTESTELFGEYTRLVEEWKKAYKEIFDNDYIADFSIHLENEDEADLIVWIKSDAVNHGVSSNIMNILIQKRGRFNPYWIDPYTHGWLKIGYYILPHDHD